LNPNYGNILEVHFIIMKISSFDQLQSQLLLIKYQLEYSICDLISAGVILT